MKPADAYGLELRVTLLPEVAERLVAGGVPPSRLPLALALLTLTGLLMGVAVLQLRRSHELVTLRAGFVRNVSHELRTPLQQILLFAELLKSGRLDDDAKRQEALDIIHAETRRLIELVRNVLRFSNDDATAVRPRPVDLGSVVQETAEAFRPLAAARNATILVRVSNSTTAHADPDAVRRVLINLLDNAVKYGPEGQTVRVDVQRTPEWAEIRVSDSGPGIDAVDRDRIWEAFGRLERESQGPTGGSGIGLSIVRRIVDAMDGCIEVGDAAPSGACFTVRLPLVGKDA
jgi:signal transduction histidine kinase